MAQKDDIENREWHRTIVDEDNNDPILIDPKERLVNQREGSRREVAAQTVDGYLAYSEGDI